MRSTWAIALSLLSSSAAFAQQTSGSTTSAARLEAARAEIAQGAYEQGIAKLQRVLDVDPRPEIVYEMAVAYSLWQGHCKDSIALFDKFFEMCQSKCSSFAAGKERFDRVRGACLVKVRVETEPAGAMISIDGDAIGSSPLEATIIAGKHAFEAELTGYSNPSASQAVAAGQEDAMIKLRLEPLPAFIEFRNVVPEAVVMISGVPAKPPKMEVQPGRHKIEASRPGYESKTIEVVARRGETAQVDVALAPEKVTYRYYMWGSVGISVFTLASTAAFALMAKEAKSDRETYLAMGGKENDDYTLSQESRIKSRTTLAIVMGSVSGAAAIAALVFFFIEPDQPPDKVALGFGPDGLVISGAF